MAEVQARPAAGLPILDHIDSRIVQELALGLDESADILARYGVTGHDAERLLASPFLKNEVAALTTELRRAGTGAKVKARIIAEELIGRLYAKVKDSHSIPDLLDCLKILAKIGDLEPRDTQGKITSTIVRVDLNLGALALPPRSPLPSVRTTVTDVEAHDVDHAVPDIDGELCTGFLGLPVEPIEPIEPVT